jgi:Leucine-rich repeat (LRR) protein
VFRRVPLEPVDADEAEKAVLEGCGISSVISEDLSFFRKLTHLDLGDNQVQLASLAYLPALVELHLDCNGLIEVTIPPGGFPTLEVLNLSYNGLTAAAIAALAPGRDDLRECTRTRVPMACS